jgi:hypothetical protein
VFYRVAALGRCYSMRLGKGVRYEWMPSNPALQVFYGTLPLILIILGVWFREQLLLKDILARIGRLEERFEKRMERLEKRMERIEDKLSSVERRLTVLEPARV